VLQGNNSFTRLCGVGNQFDDEYMHYRLSSLTRLCDVENQFTDEYVHHGISSLPNVCFADKFPDESVLQ
jgi:hypothetical protein